MAHKVPVSKPLGNGLYGLPNTTRVREVNLPDYLKPGHLVTQEGLDAVDAVDLQAVQALSATARADVLAQVNDMLANVQNPAFVMEQSVPAASVIVNHNLGRRAVAVTVYSLDYETQYEFFQVYPIDGNNIQLAFDEPLEFVALVS